MEQASGLDHKRYRRGRRRRDTLRLYVRAGLSLLLLAIAVVLAAGIIRVVERPLPPIRGMSDLVPPGADPLRPLPGTAAAEPASADSPGS